MKTSRRLLDTTAADVMRLLADGDYSGAVGEILSLTSPTAAAYVTAFVTRGLKLSVADAFLNHLREALDEEFYGADRYKRAREAWKNRR